MADVRQLLRAERAGRRITHPHASYTSDGKLLCNLCDTFVKSETQWQSHLHSTQHNLRSQRAKDANELRGTGKKRKAESPTLEAEDGRKRVRPEDAVEDVEDDRPKKVVKFAEDIEENHVEAEPPATNGAQQTDEQPRQEDVEATATVDDAELLAFERDLAELESRPNATNALNAEATISAAPLTAEQLAAQASEEQSTQRGRRDAELEEEKEDAARVLEEEFEEMRGMEDRLKRLRERREELRRPSDVADQEGVANEVLREVSGIVNGSTVESDAEDEDDDEFDDWGFGGVG